MVWNCQNDTLQIGDVRFDGQQSVVITQRGVLKAIARIFDPLGLVTPVTFRGRVFIQELWKEDVKRDESLPEILCQRWRSILQRLKSLSLLVVSRFIGSIRDSISYELLVFCDASNATAVYLHIQYQKKSISPK